MRTAASTSEQPILLPKLNRLGCLEVVLLGLGLCRIAETTPGAWHRNDFAHYYLSARAMMQGDSPYTTNLQPLCERYGFEYDPRIRTGTNPPALNLLVSGVAWLPPLPAYAIWTLFQATLLAGLLAMLMRMTSPLPGQTWQWLAAGVVLSSTAVWSHFHYSQVQLLIAVLIASAYYLRSMQRGNSAVLLIVLAAAFKAYPAALLPWFVLAGQGGWPGVRRRATVAVGVSLAIFLITGPLAWYDFFTHGLATVQRSVVGSTSNYSLQSAAAMLTGGALGRPLPEATLRTTLLASRLLAAAGIGAVYLLIWLRKLDARHAITLLTLAMMLASPVCWSHYLVLMILPAWLSWAELAANPRSTANWLAAVLAAVCLCSEMDAGVPIASMGLARTALHFYPTAALVLFGLVTLTSGYRTCSTRYAWRPSPAGPSLAGAAMASAGE